MPQAQAPAPSRVWNARTYAQAPRRAYPKPTGNRLQLSGQWLTDAGFQPGAAYSVRPMSAGIRVEVGSAGATVTASHGAAKLYVPAELLAADAKSTVEVLQVAPGKLLVRVAH